MCSKFIMAKRIALIIIIVRMYRIEITFSLYLEMLTMVWCSSRNVYVFFSRGNVLRLNLFYRHMCNGETKEIINKFFLNFSYFYL